LVTIHLTKQDIRGHMKQNNLDEKHSIIHRMPLCFTRRWAPAAFEIILKPARFLECQRAAESKPEKKRK